MKQVIACIDGSAIASAVCDAAAWASIQLNKPLILLHTLEKHNATTADDLSGTIGLGAREHLLDELVTLDEKRSKLALEHGKQLLEKAQTRALADGAKDVSLRQRHGDVLDALSDLEEDTRLFVLGRSGEDHPQQSQEIGAHIENATRMLKRPILITVGEFKPPQRFMIAYDGRETVAQAIAKIATSRLLKGLPCHLVFVGEDTPKQREKLNQAVQPLVDHGFSVITQILNGDIFTRLHQYQKEHDIELLVMGANAHSRVRQFFVGSNTVKMIAQATTTLLVIK